MRQRIASVLAVVVMAAGIGFLAGRGTSDAAHDDASAVPPDAAAIASAEARDAPMPGRQPATAAVADAPLPDLELPLLQIHDTLQARAAAGDARAACRLAAEHEACERHRTQTRAMDAHDAQLEAWIAGQPQPLQPAAQQRVDQRRSQLTAMRTQQDAAGRRCEAAPVLSPGDRARYWRQAALAGHVPAMRHYASGNAFRLHDLMDALPALQTYRREAEGIAMRAARGGDVASLYLMAMAYANVDTGQWRPFLAQSVTPDLAKALALFSALSRHPAITALPDGHPVAATVAGQHRELQAAATFEETAQAAREAALIRLPDRVPETPQSLQAQGSIPDITADDCNEALPRTR